MKPTLKAFAALVLLAFLIMACSLFSPTHPTEVPVEDIVNTRVAATLNNKAAEESQTPEPSATDIGLTPAATQMATDPAQLEPAGLLPQALYFLAKDQAGLDQVWRLDTDGKTLAQITYETVAVSDFDVSSKGVLAYIANNQLLLVDSNGANRQLLADGGANDYTDVWTFTHQISNPRWSPDGEILAYGQNGLNLYVVSNGTSHLLLPSEIDDQNEYLFPRALYSASRWSPDGSLLLIEIGYYEGSDYGVYNQLTGELVKLVTSGQSAVCCTNLWSPDGKSIYTAGYSYGGLSSEVWRFDAGTGQGTELIAETSPSDGTYNYADWPHVRPDGSLIYFYSNLTSQPQGTIPLFLVTSNADGVTDWTTVRPESLLLTDALWSPQGDLVIAVQPLPGEPTYPPRGSFLLIYTDGRPTQALVPDARTPKWGP